MAPGHKVCCAGRRYCQRQPVAFILALIAVFGVAEADGGAADAGRQGIGQIIKFLITEGAVVEDNFVE